MKKPKISILVSVLGLILIVVFFIDLAVGSADITIGEFIRVLFGKPVDETIKYIIFDVRMPRAITAVLTGSGLALAGLILQTLFHNPLADPFVLGISSGASLGVAIYVMASSLLIGISPLFSMVGQVVAAIAGASLVFILILVFSWRINQVVSLLIIGIMVGSVASAIINILQYFATPEKVQRFVIWTLGSLGSTGWPELLILMPVLLIAVFLSFLIIKPMDALLMGESHARVTGVNVKRTRFMMIMISGILTGILTAFTGPIAFVGITVPHIVRIASGKVVHRTILPLSVFTGALFLLLCDIISQLPGKATTLPINTVTALFGAPIVVFLIIKNRNLKSSF